MSSKDTSKSKIPKEKDINKESIKILSIAAFCFSIVSFQTTSSGLDEFVFNDQWLICTLISFSIQSILFVFNLKFPKILMEIWTGIKYWWIYIFRLILMLIIFILYFSVLIGSSLFSFIYIYNSSYLEQDINKIDADVILSSSYNEALKEYSDYLTENIKFQEIVLYNMISELALSIDYNNKQDVVNNLDDSEESNHNTADQKIFPEYDSMTIEELDAEIKIQEGTFNTTNDLLNSKLKLCETYERQRDGVVWVSQQQYNDDRGEYQKKIDEVTQEIEKLTQDVQDAEDRRKEATRLLTQKKNSTATKKDQITTDLLKLNLNKNKTDIDFTPIISGIEELIGNYKESNKGKDNTYGEMAMQLQEINIVKNNYNTLLNYYADLQKEKDNKNSNNSEDDEAKYTVSEWKEKYNNLISWIYTVPSYNSSASDNNIENIVNINELKKFEDKRFKIAEELENSRRLYLSDISIIEKSYYLLFKENRYKFTAIFSCLFAVFLDLSSLAVGLYMYIFEANDKRQDKKRCD